MNPLIEKFNELVPPRHGPSVARRAGVAGVTITNWQQCKRDPRLSLFEAALNVTGHRLEIVPIEKG